MHDVLFVVMSPIFLVVSGSLAIGLAHEAFISWKRCDDAILPGLISFCSTCVFAGVIVNLVFFI